MWNWDKLHQNLQNSMSFQMEPNDRQNSARTMKVQSALMLFFLLQMLKCFLKRKLLRSAQLLRRPSKMQTGRVYLFFIFPLFPICSLLCSHHVPNVLFKLPMCSPRVFPIVSCCNPLQFCPKSSPSHLYRCGPKGQKLHHFHRIFYFGEPPQFQPSFFFVMGQSNWLIAKKNKLDL